jgi:hypothetical protein
MKNNIAGLIAAMVLSFAFVHGADAATNLSADWQGKLDAGAVKLRVVFKIAQAPDGGLTATMYSIDQGAQAIPVDKVTRETESVAMEVKAVQGGFKGTLNATGDTITGQWNQRGNSLPLTLTRVGPDNPPFKAEEIPAGDVAASKAAAEKITGVWNGTLVAGPGTLRLRVSILKTESGAAAGTMDSLDQGANGIPLRAITLKDGKVRFDVRTVGGVYEGELSADGSLIKGEWRQSGQALPLEFKKT